MTIDLQNNRFEIVRFHWDGIILPGLNILRSKEERLSNMVSFDYREQIFEVRKQEDISTVFMTGNLMSWFKKCVS